MRWFSAAVACAAWAGSTAAHADPPAFESEATYASCGLSYNERLADARSAIQRSWEYDSEVAAYRPALDWFEQHCRFLEWEEIVVRKLDDPDSFVCDTNKGRPKGLNAEQIQYFQHNGRELTVSVLVKWGHSNLLCREHDEKAGRPSLVFAPLPQDASRDARRSALIAKIDVMCWQVVSEKCTKTLASVASWRKRPATP